MRRVGAKVRLSLQEEWASWARSKKNFRKLDPVDIVIFDACDAGVIDQCLPTNSVFILHIRGEKFHMNLKTLSLRVWFFIKYRRPRWSYFLAILQQLKPKVVITFIDNNVVFHQLSNYFTKSIFIAVQNGWRFPYYQDPFPGSEIYKSKFLCWGENDVAGWMSAGSKFDSVIPIGSLKASLSLRERTDPSHVERTAQPIAKRVLWISGFRRHSFLPTLNEEELLAWKLRMMHLIERKSTLELRSFSVETINTIVSLNYMLTFKWLMRAVSEIEKQNRASISLEIVANLANDAANLPAHDELTFYSTNAAGCLFTLLPKTSPMSSYYHVQQGDVIVSWGSSLSIEALGMGKRVLISEPVASPLKLLNFNVPWWLTNHGYEDFNQALIDLLAQTDAEYQYMYKKQITYYSGQPTAKPTYELVRDEVMSALAQRGSNQD